jgi:hypothetical protein
VSVDLENGKIGQPVALFGGPYQEPRVDSAPEL